MKASMFQVLMLLMSNDIEIKSKCHICNSYQVTRLYAYRDNLWDIQTTCEKGDTDRKFLNTEDTFEFFKRLGEKNGSS